MHFCNVKDFFFSQKCRNFEGIRCWWHVFIPAPGQTKKNNHGLLHSYVVHTVVNQKNHNVTHNNIYYYLFFSIFILEKMWRDNELCVAFDRMKNLTRGWDVKFIYRERAFHTKAHTHIYILYITHTFTRRYGIPALKARDGGAICLHGPPRQKRARNTSRASCDSF